MQAATVGRYTCALIALFLLLQPVDSAPFAPTSAVDPAPFLDQALSEVRAERVLAGVRKVPVASPVSGILPGRSVESVTTAATPTDPEPEPAATAVTVTVREGQSLWALAAE